MTTLAWDGKTMAADRRGISAGFPYSMQKIFKLSDGRIYAGSGNAEWIAPIRAWLEGIGDKPALGKDDDFVGMVAYLENGKLVLDRYESKLFPMRVLDECHAIGSGRDYAMSAMVMGKSAKEAIEFACQYDIYTGNGVDSIDFEVASL